jgi:cysteine desulfurase
MICITRRLFLTIFQKGGFRLAGLQLVELFKQLFGIRRNVYLDYNATTMVSENVRKVMHDVLKKNSGNPSSLYESGKRSAEIIDHARGIVAEAINAERSEMYFTGCATESNNTVLKSLFEHNYPGKKRIVALPIEHPSIIKTLESLQDKGLDLKYCPVDINGVLLFDELEKLIDDSTLLVCCMLANNETGVVQDVRRVVDTASRQGVPVLCDCVQAFGKIPVNVKSLGVNYASFSAHKIYGPKGIGALYVKKGSMITPLIHGGHQEQGMRAGTESVHNIAGFGAACLSIEKHIAHADRLRNLKNRLIQELKVLRPDCVINSPEKNVLSNTINVTFPGIKNQALMGMLNYYGIEVSAGSACSSSDDKPSHVLTAIGLSETAARETIRISMGTFTRKKEIDHLIKVLKNYFDGKAAYVSSIESSRLDEAFLLNPHVFIIDVRPEFQRKKTPGLSCFHPISYGEIENKLQYIPRDKLIIIVCESGQLSMLSAYNLKSKGYDEVYSVKDGFKGWMTANRELYKKYSELQPKEY